MNLGIRASRFLKRLDAGDVSANKLPRLNDLIWVLLVPPWTTAQDWVQVTQRTPFRGIPVSILARIKKRVTLTPPTGATPSTGAQAPLLRDRLVLFGLGGVVFALIRLGVQTVSSCNCASAVYELFFMNPAPIFLSLTAMGGFLIVAAVAYWLPLGQGALKWLDRLSFISIFGIAAWLAQGLGLDVNASTNSVFAVILVSMWRAAVVPSHAVNTFTVTTATVLLSQSPGYLFQRAESNFILDYSMRISWLIVAILIATTTSNVIYRLRRRSRAAEALGQYRLEKKLGAGGMGEVYLAKHALMCRPVAVKVLRKDSRDESSIQRFEREVRLTSILKHPNTITIYDFGQSESGEFFYVMEHLRGMDLKQVIDAGGALAAPRALHIIRQACGSLSEAHEHGLIHRDIKPANIFLCEQGGLYDFVKVLDFGLVKHVKSADEASLTQDMSVLGTPLFLSPEAIRGEDVDERSDIYALGCVAWNLLTGKCLFDGGSVVEVLSRHLNLVPKRPSSFGREDIPADFEAIIMHCLEKDANDRPASVKVLAQMLALCDDADCWSQDIAEAAFENNMKAAQIPDSEALLSEQFISLMRKDITLELNN